MTARHQIRVGNRRLGRDRAPIDATPAPTTGEMLQAAREKKGVDLYRAERDTKIRAKYLAALEQSDAEELPSPVYTMGFLRNYALYLGLDPEEVLTRWKSEAVVPREAKPIVVAPPRPIETPRRGLTITPGLFVGLLLSIAILAFLGYVVLQVFRFSQPPALVLTSPATPVITVDADHYVLVGTANPGATIAIDGGGDQTYRVIADTNGRWEKDVPLTKGQNDFRIVATDPETSTESKPTSLIITVPLPIATVVPGATLPAPGATSGPAIVVPVTLAVTQPLEGATFKDGAVAISGTTSGSSVTVTAQQALAAGSQPSAAPASSPSAAPTRAVAAPTNGPAPLQLTPIAGSYSGTMNLPPGDWRLDITATGAGLGSSTESRTVNVAFTGLTLLIEAKKGPAWIKVWIDGRVAAGYTVGKILTKGDSVSITADRSVTVRTGNSGATSFSVNGVSKGILGLPGRVETWLFQLDRQPIRTASQ